MKKINLVLFLVILCQISSASLLDDIIEGKFRTKYFDMPRSMNNGEDYTSLINNKAIVKYKYKTGGTIDTLFSISKLKNKTIKSISGYILSPNETKILIYNNVKYRYRRSFTADYYVYDIKRNELQLLSENGSQESPLFSPDSRYIAFGRENNLFLKKLDFNTEISITTDGKFGSIINGIADWVYEEEFEKSRMFEFSPDSKLLAYVKFDESEVKEYSFPYYLKKINKDDELSTYPTFYKFKYPKAGEYNSKVSVCVYDDSSKSTRVMDIENGDTDFYIPRIKWTNSPDQLAVFKLNRNQNKLDMFLANPRSTVSKLILREEDKRYVNFEYIDFINFAQDNQSFIGVSEKDGYSHVYQYSINGNVIKQLTKGKWDVTDVYGYDEKNKILYFQSAETSPVQRDIFSIDSKGKKNQLSNGKGTHVASFSKNLSLFVDNYSSVESPTTINLKSNTGLNLRLLSNNDDLKKKIDELGLPQKEFFKFSTSENIELNGWMLKPLNFDTNKKYPVLQVQYSGPNSQSATDIWRVDWEYYLASKGYIVVCVDGRGTGGRGSEFRKCTYEQLTVLETKDQVETAKYLGNQNFVDKNRIGIWGWSYGGTMTLSCMTSPEKVFSAGISVAPVTDFKLYDTTYAERYMKRPQENFKGYDTASLLSRADKLNGKLLLIHGTADDNVHVQNSMLFIDKLVEANKQFEMQFYTDKDHSIVGLQTRKHLYTRMSEFLFKNL